MYTINLKDLQVTPPINDGFTISGNTEAEVQKKMEDYILSKYPGMYNPYTLSRKLFEITKDDSGENYADRFKKEKSEFHTKIEEDAEKLSVETNARIETVLKGSEEIRQSYEKTLEPLREKIVAIRRSTELTDEERAKQEDEIQTEVDKIQWEIEKKIEDLRRQEKDKKSI
jgi:hypothetical protein